MEVPYAKKWQQETDALRRTALDCGLVEELKWGKPCFTYEKRNVLIVIPLKDVCALSFYTGGPLDQIHIPQEIAALPSTLRSYIYEAIQVDKSGKRVPLKKASEYVVPEELQVRPDAAPS